MDEIDVVAPVSEAGLEIEEELLDSEVVLIARADAAGQVGGETGVRRV